MTQNSDLTVDRGTLLKTSSSVLGTLAISQASAKANDSKKVFKVGVIGLGGRGAGAVTNILDADPNTILWSVGEIQEKKLTKGIGRLKKYGERIQVENRVFDGFDAYQKVIDSGVDIVLLTTTPAFRPMHLEACIEAGKHVFAEKPLAVDIPGMISVEQTAKKAKKKGLSILTGFVYRYTKGTKDFYEAIQNGAIGKVTSAYSTYLAGQVNPIPPTKYRPKTMSDLEWSLPFWQNFVELAGDSIVEQSIHSVDKLNWAMEQEQPIAAIANGGRQVNLDGANIFDHFSVTYEYANGRRAFLSSRQLKGGYKETKDEVFGTDGHGVHGKGIFKDKLVKEIKRSGLGYTDEHKLLMSHIRAGKVFSDIDTSAAQSTYMAILGRMAAYTGKRITWEQMMASKDSMINTTDISWSSGFKPRDVSLPGITPFV